MADGTDFEVVNGPTRIRVTGLRRTVRALEQSGADAQDMRDLMHALGSIVVDAAQPPAVSGKLAGSIRAGRGKTKAVVRAGGARVPYAGPIHYGWPEHNIAPQPFLSEALQAERSDIFRALEEGLEAITRRNNL
jgi:hypothetical protein